MYQCAVIVAQVMYIGYLINFIKEKIMLIQNEYIFSDGVWAIRRTLKAGDIICWLT